MAANSLLTPSLITKETLVILTNNLVAAGKVNRQFENQFVKIGTTLTVRKPNRFTVTLGPALKIQDITEPQTSITISSSRASAISCARMLKPATIDRIAPDVASGRLR